MTRKITTALTAALMTSVLAAPGAAQGPRTARAVFAGGCFWTVEYRFEQIPGVTSAVSGFSGGDERNPRYEDVVAHRTGHLEAVEVTYDPRRISYRQLVDRFWRMIDPTDAGGQACDRGDNYRTAVFTSNAAEREAALASKAAIDTGPRRGKIVTEIRAAKPFWPAGREHQDFYKTNAATYQRYDAGCRRGDVLARVWADER